MIYIIIITGLICGTANLIMSIKDKRKINYRVNCIVYAFAILITLIMLMFIIMYQDNREQYINELENKVNMLEVNYSEYALKDSIEQQKR